MSVAEVRKILEPVRSRRFPKPRFSTMDDFPEHGRAVLNYQENGGKMTILFLDGTVVDKSRS